MEAKIKCAFFSIKATQVDYYCIRVMYMNLFPNKDYLSRAFSV